MVAAATLLASIGNVSLGLLAGRLLLPITTLGLGENGTVLEQLGPHLVPELRVKMLLALVGLVILGLMMMLLTWWGGRFTRRYTRQSEVRLETYRDLRSHEDDWVEKPLVPDPPTEEDP